MPPEDEGAKRPDEETLKRRYKEFLDLLPLTCAIAGMSVNEGNRNFTTEQLEIRAQAMINAFKYARQTIREVLKNG